MQFIWQGTAFKIPIRPDANICAGFISGLNF